MDWRYFLADTIFMDAITQILMPTWHRDRVVLVGDACDCPTLISGQGASLAMWGAYNMAEVLHETASSQGAFQRYEQQMRPHIEAQQKSARGFAKTFLPGSRLSLFFQQVMLKVFLREAFHCLLRRQSGAPSILPASQHGEASDTITNVISTRLSTHYFC